MRKFVYITTPIPTLEEVAKRHKISKARQKRILEIMRSPAPRRTSVRQKDTAGSSNGHLRNGKSMANGTALSKKNNSAAAS
jgi:hypothetical protein